MKKIIDNKVNSFSELNKQNGSLIGLINTEFELSKQPFFLALISSISKGHQKGRFNIVYDSQIGPQTWKLQPLKRIAGLWIPNHFNGEQSPSISYFTNSGHRPFSINRACSGIIAISENLKEKGLDFYIPIIQSKEFLSSYLLF